MRYVRAMKVTFVRSPGQRLRTIAERRDGVTVGVTGAPDRDGRLPHDLAHFVVEKELGLDSGFWGGIAQGRLFRGAEIVSGPPLHKRLTSPRQTRTRPGPAIEAEVLVRIYVAIWTGEAVREYGSVRAYLDAQPAPRTRSRAEEIHPETIDRVCKALDVIDAQWGKLSPGGELVLAWPDAARS